MNSNQASLANEAVRQPPSDGSTTIEASETESSTSNQGPTLRLRLKPQEKSKERRKVQWTSETVDNEHLGRKKSKCCCVFVKKRPFGQSDSEDSDEGDNCDHCSGHTPSDPKNKS